MQVNCTTMPTIIPRQGEWVQVEQGRIGVIAIPMVGSLPRNHSRLQSGCRKKSALRADLCGLTLQLHCLFSGRARAVQWIEGMWGNNESDAPTQIRKLQRGRSCVCHDSNGQSARCSPQ